MPGRPEIRTGSPVSRNAAAHSADAAGRRRSETLVQSVGLGITLAAAVLIAVLLLFIFSGNPSSAMFHFFLGPFASRFAFGSMLNTSIPLIFAGLGIATAFRASLFNLGGEGQLYLGALVSAAVCLALPGSAGIVGISVALITASAAGAVLAGISGFLKMKWETDLLISSFLISSAVVLIVNYIITGPLDDPNSSLLATARIASRFRLPAIFPPSKLDIGIFLAAAAAVLVHLLLFSTHFGYELRMCGLNREFARYGGIRVSTYVVMPMIISGALHGFGGGLTVLGTHYMALKDMTAGMGWNGIAVALIAVSHPLGVIPAALFFAYLDSGAKAAMLHTDVTFEIAAVVQAVIFYLVTAQAIYSRVRAMRRRRLIGRRGTDSVPEAGPGQGRLT